MLTFAFGCAATLQPAPLDTAQDTGALTSRTDDSGHTIQTTTLDATDHEQWLYLDLSTGALQDATEPGWDLAVQRYTLALRGGLIGEGDVLAVSLGEADFDTLTEAPLSGYETDRPDEDGDGTDEYVLGDWYDYAPDTHVLTPAGVTYVVATPDGHHRLQILDYYNAAGTSGHPTIQWGAIDAPATE